MCKVELDINIEENIDFLVYSTILSLDKEFTFEQIEELLLEKNKAVYDSPKRNSSIQRVLNVLLEKSIIHDNFKYYLKMN